MKTFLAVVFIMIVWLAPVFWWYGTPVRIRYRLTVEIENAGKLERASSVINVDYYPYRMFRGMAPGTGGPAFVKGVAPMFDLGAKGTLIAALYMNNLNPGGSRYGPSYAIASALPMRTYGVKVHDVYRVRYREPVWLAPMNHPAFIWVPPSNRWQDAKAMLSSDVPQIVAPDVSVKRVKFAPDYNAPVIEKIEPAPKWLVDLREASRRMRKSNYPDFTMSKIDVETAFVPRDWLRGR